jgi:hypothetical protein
MNRQFIRLSMILGSGRIQEFDRGVHYQSVVVNNVGVRREFKKGSHQRPLLMMMLLAATAAAAAAFNSDDCFC